MKKFNKYNISLIVLILLCISAVFVLPVIEINLWFDPNGWITKNETASVVCKDYVNGCLLIILLELYCCSWVYNYFRYEFFTISNLHPVDAMYGMGKKEFSKAVIVIVTLVIEHLILHFAVYSRIASYWGRTTMIEWTPVNFAFHSLLGIATPIYFIIVGWLKCAVDPDYFIMNPYHKDSGARYGGHEIYIFWRI